MKKDCHFGSQKAQALISLFPFTTFAGNNIRTIPVIFQPATVLASLPHPGHIVAYAHGDSLTCRLLAD